MSSTMNIFRVSENTVIILFDQVIDADNFSVIKQCVRNIKTSVNDKWIADIIISYASIHITFNLLAVSGIDFTRALKLALLLSNGNDANNDNADKAESDQCSPSNTIEIPVYYGEEVALDLVHVANNANLTKEEVIAIHTSQIYDVYAIGFAPGFAYLGNVDTRIATARKPTPRQKVARGSVGIADQQTAIYPSESPGGWQIIGRTPIQLIDYNSANLTQFTAGDKVNFTAMSQAEYLQMGGEL